jgi:hypothetical protein
MKLSTASGPPEPPAVRDQTERERGEQRADDEERKIDSQRPDHDRLPAASRAVPERTLGRSSKDSLRSRVKADLPIVFSDESPLRGFAASRTISGVRSFFKLALIAAGIVVALAISELALRILDVSPRFQVIFRESIQPSDHPVLGYELRPGAPDGRRFRISSAGLRDREHSLQKPDAAFRIAAIGDSITYGLGSPRARSWVEGLENMLNARAVSGSPRFEVLNFGVPGYHIGQVVQMASR